MDHPNLLTDPEVRRFTSQISLPQIGLVGQENLKKAKVAVVGAGGLGSIVLQYLAAIGIGHLEIIDYALVQETNIQRQLLYGGNDLGKLKTIISKQNLQNLFPFVKFGITNIQLTHGNAEKLLMPFDYVIDASNNEDCHLIIDQACSQLNLPWVYGSLSEYVGHISVMNASKGFRFSHIQQHVQPARKDNEEGRIALMYGLVGNLMAFELLKLIIGHDDVLFQKLLRVDLLTYQFTVKAF